MTSLETISKKILGKIGEDVPQNEFTDIKNLNDIKHNFPVFDIIAKKMVKYMYFQQRRESVMGQMEK